MLILFNILFLVIMAAEDDIELIEHQLHVLEVNENWAPTEDYYVHIDIVHGSSSLVKSRINAFMIRGDAFDPRVIFQFPTDLLEPNEDDTLRRRRELAGIGPNRYEFWKVRKNFSLAAFRQMVAGLPNGVVVRIVRMIDNDHDINVYHSG